MEISAPGHGRTEENVLFVASGQVGKRPHMLAAGRNRHRLRTVPAVGSDMEMDADDGSGQGRVRVLRPSGRTRRVDGDERREE